jgi:hypothetical protein
MKKTATIITFLFLFSGGFYFFAGDENPLEPDTKKYQNQPADEPTGSFLPKKDVKKKDPSKKYNPENYPNPYENPLNNPYNNPYKKSYN